MVCAPVKAGMRVEGTLRSAVMREMFFERREREEGEEVSRVRPRMVYCGRVRKWVATDEPLYVLI